jgi:hypothetical protein
MELIARRPVVKTSNQISTARRGPIGALRVHPAPGISYALHFGAKFPPKPGRTAPWCESLGLETEGLNFSMAYESRRVTHRATRLPRKIIRICRNPPLFGVVASYLMSDRLGAVVPIASLEFQPAPGPVPH